MYRLELEKAEDDRRARGFQKNIYSASVTMQKTLTVWITTNWKILKEMGTPEYLPPEKSACRSRSNVIAGESFPEGWMS